MHKIIATTLIFILYSAATTAAIKGQTIEDIKLGFIRSVTEKMKDFKVCEYYSSSENKRNFIKRSFNPTLLTGSQNLVYREIFITNIETNDILHLGIVVIKFTEAAYLNLLESQYKKSGFLNNTKILTKYVMKTENQQLKIYYSETFIDEKIKKYFGNIK